MGMHSDDYLAKIQNILDTTPDPIEAMEAIEALGKVDEPDFYAERVFSQQPTI